MSDFLSKFNEDKYNELLDEQEEKEPKKPKESNDQNEITVEENSNENNTPESRTNSETNPVTKMSRRNDSVEEVEIDPTYQKKKRRKMLLLIVGSVLALVLVFSIYYNAVHVEAEEFVDKPVSDARAWATTNDIEMELTEEYSMEHDSNRIISQSVLAGESIRKGKTISLISSLGPDPEAVIPLPDFTAMNQSEVESWIEENKAENLQLVTEFSDEVEEDNFIKLVIRDTSIDEAEYRRKDSAAVYFSKGKEVFEKNIVVPDFTGVTKAEVEQWAKTNEIDMKYENKDSNSVEVDQVISQSVAAEEKVAKRDEMKVVVSIGKASVVPNFAQLTVEEASSYPGLTVTVKQKYHANVSYGGLISQSVDAGTKLTESDDTNVTVVYSEGRPYLGDYRGMLEGELAKTFYETYKSKGADISYIVKYVDAPEVKGTVVGMSKFNEFVPMTYTVEIKVSKNASAASSPQAEPEPEEEVIEPIEEPEEPEEPVEIPEEITK
ncbi:Stk1 family PASTA domain-containing Ser/Thr kinase [Aquibacillus rhizosphaerae]|uniref:PASTA domain-containing protein n=1 Tax=Aquibacillus rhizosphaerae TaxID=3051431 RepID=A0ABT7LD19_9BACI|nr:Stk1 family PASTA domain-containing Ser/Thr kinase [Aquibacillus sp. LR5S19]MDL4843157.1 PASTA domain-containing protein [Aquibacillus sp. LR5S19]